LIESGETFEKSSLQVLVEIRNEPSVVPASSEWRSQSRAEDGTLRSFNKSSAGGGDSGGGNGGAGAAAASASPLGSDAGCELAISMVSTMAAVDEVEELRLLYPLRLWCTIGTERSIGENDGEVKGCCRSDWPDSESVASGGSINVSNSP